MKDEFSQILSDMGGQGDIVLLDFVINLGLTAVLTYLVGLLYDRYSRVLSNRKIMIKTFVLVGMTTMVIISIVKSSVALSLGLVGALSIVRFRTAIKEPEELAYFFMSIAIGLGMGADQKWVTILGFVLLGVIIIILGGKKIVPSTQNLVIRTKDLSETEILGILKQHTQSLDLRRFDNNLDYSEFAFVVEFSSIDNLVELKNTLSKQNKGTSISFISNN